MTDIPINNNSVSNIPAKPLSTVLIMVCIYIFLVIERPWESIRHLQDWPIERVFAIAMILVAILNRKFKFVNSPTNKWVYGLLTMHFFLAPFAFNSGYAVDQGIEYAKMVVLYLMMLSVVDDEESLRFVVKAYVFSMMFYALHSLLEYSNGRHVYRMGISRMVGVDSTYNDPNAFGASVVLSLPFVYSLLRAESKVWLRRLYYGYYAIVVTCVVLTGSRSAFVAILFLALLWVLSQKGVQKLKILAIIVPVIFLVWSAMPEEKQNRIRTLWDKEAGPANATESAEGRKEGFRISWKMFKQVPFTGVGAGGKNFIGYRMANKIDEVGHETPLQAHVLYGEVLAEFGVFGAFLLSGLTVSIIRSCLVIRSRLNGAGVVDGFSYDLAGAILGALLLLLFLGLGGHNFYRPLWLWLAAWSGALLNIMSFRLTRLSER